MANLSTNNIAQAIYLGSKEKGHNQSEYLQEVVQFLAKKRLLSKSKEILEALEKIINKEEGRIVAKITSTKSVGREREREISQLLKKRYSVEHVVIQEVIDEKTLGGMKIEVGDEVIDLTVKNKIKQLQEYLTRNV